MDLYSLGWNDYFQACFNNITENNNLLKPARIICGYKNQYRINFGEKECLAIVSGKFRYNATTPSEYPVVGDWVTSAYDENHQHAVIHHLLPRKTLFSRKAAGPGIDEQVISANIDTVFIVTDFGYDYNERRIERYLTLVYESGVTPVIILNKSDMCENTGPYLKRTESITFGVPVLIISSKTKSGFDSLYPFLKQGKTASFLGSSGVGKSSIINTLAGNILLKTNETRSGGKGKHTTTHRELFVLDDMGIVIDNPGMREIQLWADEEAPDGVFSDIEELALSCRFDDCSHSHEPGCAVLDAVNREILDKKRYTSYLKQKNELNQLSKYKGLSKKEIRQKRRDEDRKFSKMIRKMKKPGK